MSSKSSGNGQGRNWLGGLRDGRRQRFLTGRSVLYS